MDSTDNKEKYMSIAYEEALKAYKKLEVPVGAIIVKDGVVIAKAHNLREKNKNCIAHAEMLVLNKACKKLKAWRLEGCEMYVTLEPCFMCAGAITQTRIRKVYIGAMDPKNGAVGSKVNIFDIADLSKVEYETGILEDKCSNILTNFFKELRVIKSKNKCKK